MLYSERVHSCRFSPQKYYIFPTFVFCVELHCELTVLAKGGTVSVWESSRAVCYSRGGNDRPDFTQAPQISCLLLERDKQGIAIRYLWSSEGSSGTF